MNVPVNSYRHVDKGAIVVDFSIGILESNKALRTGFPNIRELCFEQYVLIQERWKKQVQTYSLRRNKCSSVNRRAFCSLLS